VHPSTTNPAAQPRRGQCQHAVPDHPTVDAASGLSDAPNPPDSRRHPHADHALHAISPTLPDHKPRWKQYVAKATDDCPETRRHWHDGQDYLAGWNADVRS